MFSEIISKINQLSLSIGLGSCLQQDIFGGQCSLSTDFFEDCLMYSGDNINGLSSLANTSPSSIGFCYIDPPYNCSGNFVYNDHRKGSLTGVWGKHSEWMEFMLPRLVFAHYLLKSDGAIAISIDDYEFPYLKILMDKIFGEENFIGNIITCRSKNGKGSKKNIASCHEYLVVYGKTKGAFLRGVPDSLENYDKSDQYGHYRVDGLFRKKGDASLREDRPNMYYPLYYNENGEVFFDSGAGLKEAFPIDSKGIERRWLWGKDTAKERAYQLYASPNGVIYVKNYFSPEDRKKIRTLWDDAAYYTERGTKEIKAIYGAKVFDTPKPLSYITDIIDQMSKPNDVILDFFAGSGTTAHAAQVLNERDGGQRKVILMESDERVPKKHVASKSFDLISDITKFRLDYLSNNFHSYCYQSVCSSDFNIDGRATYN
ncbi:MAG: site-specific DNA-methyltransferase [Vibrio sp.]|uniref:site-specific DNA-methyltransferase n=1 Tax=Vibrio sp. TaxID=678 RepID=UPI001ECFA4C6|nr:site-specific DNA-methyltransferase [Vibrio sp.]NRB69722.1 site-specific DNA-methyltransferase [Vibrio sp.]